MISQPGMAALLFLTGTLLIIISPDSSAGSGPWRKSCNTARRFCPSAVFPAKSSFPALWAAAELCSCNLPGRAHPLELISHLSEGCLCFICAAHACRLGIRPVLQHTWMSFAPMAGFSVLFWGLFIHIKECSYQATGWLWVLTPSHQLHPRLCSSCFAAFGPVGTVSIQYSNRSCSVSRVYLYLSVVNLINQFWLSDRCYTLFSCTMCLLSLILHFHTACSELWKLWLKGKWQTCEQLHMGNWQTQQRML